MDLPSQLLSYVMLFDINEKLIGKETSNEL